jgi:peptidoglycan/xylan/chitin deacetylase (PgdA/CDA1 family)
MLIVIAILLFCLLLGLQLRYNLFTSFQNGFRVLMYHQIDPERSDALTVKLEDFEKQLRYLLWFRYHIISLSDVLSFIEKGTSLPPKSVLLTFDDGYQNNFEYVLPLLKKYNVKATIFLPVRYIGKINAWDNGSEPLMDFDTLNAARPHFEYALHSFSHQNMAEMSDAQLSEDLSACYTTLQENNFTFLPALAYPYGRFSKKPKFYILLKETGIQLAFRIGNKVNMLPLKDRYAVKRIDIKGTDSFWTFKTKLTKGRVKRF